MGPSRLAAVTASTGGRLLSAATSAVAALRPAAKPLHPRGTVDTGVLTRSGAGDGPVTGSAWLDRPGRDEVLVRSSRAVGLPPPAPDIFGLAVRVTLSGDSYGDLLLATTGLGRVTRFTLTVARTPNGRPLTTLLPYRTPTGPVLLAATHRDDDTLDLAWAHATGPWHRFAELRLHHAPAGDADALVSFDPVRHELPGLTTYDWVRRLREPSYRTARRSR
jgi:hypothetical protein